MFALSLFRRKGGCWFLEVFVTNDPMRSLTVEYLMSSTCDAAVVRVAMFLWCEAWRIPSFELFCFHMVSYHATGVHVCVFGKRLCRLYVADGILRGDLSANSRPRDGGG